MGILPNGRPRRVAEKNPTGRHPWASVQAVMKMADKKTRMTAAKQIQAVLDGRAAGCLRRRDIRHGLPIPDCTVDSVITDPPYELAFMGKAWDRTGVAFRPETWAEVLRVAKPGACLLAFGGTRTFHRIACAIEDAGWEIRDTIMWTYGQGLPKGQDIGRLIDKAAGVERTEGVLRSIAHLDSDSRGTPGKAGFTRSKSRACYSGGIDAVLPGGVRRHTLPATAAATAWDGWNTALKPAWEPIIVAMRPLDGTFAENAKKWGVAGINVDGCRVGISKRVPGCDRIDSPSWLQKQGLGSGYGPRTSDQSGMNPNIGRWPANLIHDGSEEVLSLFPQTRTGGGPVNLPTSDCGYHGGWGPFRIRSQLPYVGDIGSAARFFYCAKASPAERTCNGRVDNRHPTVKPLALMRYLCRLTKTPTGGVVLDPLCGSGSTLIAARAEGRRFFGFDADRDAVRTARARLRRTLSKPRGRVPAASCPETPRAGGGKDAHGTLPVGLGKR